MRFDRALEPPYYLPTGEENPVYHTYLELGRELDEMPPSSRRLLERLDSARALDRGLSGHSQAAPAGTPSSPAGPNPKENA